MLGASGNPVGDVRALDPERASVGSAAVRIEPTVFADPATLGEAVAALVLARIGARPAGAPFVLGCPGGRSALSSYRALARRAAAEGTDLSGLRVLMMDEYVEQGPHGPAPVDPGLAHSCRRFGRVEIVEPLRAAAADAGVPESRRVAVDALEVPDPADPEAYEHRLDALGGVDLFLLASGAGDGHVAFNTPGSDPDSRTRVVPLPDSTRTDNLATFPSFGGRLENVPAHGVTVGVGTIRDRSAEVVMIVHGPDKQTAFGRLTAAEGYQPDWPATVVADCRTPHLYADRAAAGGPERRS